MKTLIAVIVVTVGLFAAFSIQAQGFVNLDFAAAQLSAYGQGPASVPTADAIPGWSVYYGTSQQSTVFYNVVSTGAESVSIVNTNGPGGVVGVIPGNVYTVLLAARGSSEFISASISQTAVIPSTAQSMSFEGSLLYSGYTAGWQVTINSQIIPVTPVSSVGGVYDLWAANVSAFAGQDDTLTFTALAGTPELQPGNLALDDISFSSNPIPEPSEFALAAIGAILFGWRRWRKSSR